MLIHDGYPIEPDDAPEVRGIFGDRRVGKTTLLTAMGEIDHILEGRPLLSSYKLIGIDYTPITPADLRKLDSRFEGATVLVHELSAWADAYDFFKKDTRRLSKLVSQLGKRRARFYYDDQRFLKVPFRVRNQTDEFYLLEKTGIKGIARLTVCDDEYNVLRSDIIFDGRPWWSKFDSFEVAQDALDEPDEAEHPLKTMIERKRGRLTRFKATSPDEASVIAETEAMLREIRGEV